MSKSTQVSMQLTDATQRQIDELSALGFGNRTDIVRLAVYQLHRIETENQMHWWHWAIRSKAGRQAIKEAGLLVDHARPWRGVVVDKHQWRAQPFVDPGETSLCWGDTLVRLRKELGEPDAGVFFVECTFPGRPGLDTGWERSHQTLIAVSADGNRFAWRYVNEGGS